jgi:hypothetical protein
MQMSTSKNPPKPETTKAMLITAGIHKPTFTLHHYLETKAARLRNGAPVWEFLFKCFKTGTIRRWGVEERIEERTPSEPLPEAN